MQEEIGSLEYALLMKLLEIRIVEDIHFVEELKLKAEANFKELEMKPGFLKDMYRNNIVQKRLGTATKELEHKRKWYVGWKRLSAEALGEEASLLEQPLEDVMHRYMAATRNKLHVYGILQLAVTMPIYDEHEDLPTGLTERDQNRTIETICKKCGFPEETGKAIRTLIDEFMRKTGSTNGQGIKFGAVGAVAALVAMGIAAPFIAAAIGGAMGLAGAAAMSAGYAAVGGGALAAGGLGMAGGMGIMAGGAGAVGAMAGAVWTKFFNTFPESAQVSYIAREVGHITYLAFVTGTERSEANVLRQEKTKNFLDRKHLLETEYLLNSENKISWILLQTMNLAYEKLAKLPDIKP